MRIDGTPRPATLGPRGGATRASGAGPVFQPQSGQAPPRSAATAQTATMGGIDALLALQAAGDPLRTRRKAVRRGQGMLEALEALKADLLVGRVSDGRLNQLLMLLGQARERSLPDLDGLIDDIELRARVELAKLGR